MGPDSQTTKHAYNRVSMSIQAAFSLEPFMMDYGSRKKAKQSPSLSCLLESLLPGVMKCEVFPDPSWGVSCPFWIFIALKMWIWHSPLLPCGLWFVGGRNLSCSGWVHALSQQGLSDRKHGLLEARSNHRAIGRCLE